MKTVSLKFIKLYQKFISPLFGQNCRFYPSCSNYAYEAINTYGNIKGAPYIFKRIMKCHPFHSGGIDHLPKCERKNK